MGDEGGVWAVMPSPTKRYVIFHFYWFLLTSLIVNVARRISSLSTFSSHRRPPTHAEDGITPSLVWFCFRRISYTLPHTPSTQPHPRWCDFVFGVFFFAFLHMPHLPDTLSTKRHYCWCVFMFSDFLSPSTHAEHEKTPLLVSFHVRSLSFILWNTRQAQKRTLFGVFRVWHLFWIF